MNKIIFILILVSISVLSVKNNLIYPFKSKPAILIGLPHKISDAKLAFKKRVKRKFFSGIKNNAIKNELSNQGFIIKTNKKGTTIALYEEKNIACQHGD